MKAQGSHADAIKFYEPLQDIPDVLDAAYYMDLAECYLALSCPNDAEDCFKLIVEHNPDHWQSRVALAKMYEEQGRGPEAVPLVTEVIRLGRRDALKLKEESRRRYLKAQQTISRSKGTPAGIADGDDIATTLPVIPTPT